MDLIGYLQTLTVTQGQGAGGPFPAFPWQERFLRGVFDDPDVETAALSVPRGAGKTTVLAATAAATVDGPLAAERGQVAIVASSFDQAAIGWEHAKAFLAPAIESSSKKWTVRRSQNVAMLENPHNGASIVARGYEPKRLHGLAPTLVLADEPSQWPASVRSAMLAALETALGKIPGSRMVAIGTQSNDAGNWFQTWLAGGCDYAELYAAGKDDDVFSPLTWFLANPSLLYFPALEKSYRRESAGAETSDEKLAAFKALRLNMGVADVLRAELLTVEQWRACEREPDLVLQPHMIGRGLEASLAMSLPGPSLMSPSPSRPAHRKVIILGALPQQPA